MTTPANCVATALPDCTFIGSGPVGCLMAALMADLGLKCEIWEKRPDPRTLEERGKSINLSLSARGFLALSQLKPEDQRFLQSIKLAVPARGRRIHRINQPSAYQPYGENPEDVTWAVSRKNLNDDLLNLVEHKKIPVHFNQQLHRVDFDAKIAYFVAGTETRPVPFKTLWGCDGSNSIIRTEIEKYSGTKGRTEKYNSGYKEFYLAPGKNGEYRLQWDAFHVWPRDGRTFFISIPNPDGSFTCTLFCPISGPECVAEFSDEQILNLFSTQFPEFYEAMGPHNIVMNHRQNPFGSMYNVDTPLWHVRGDAVILGDAAFGVVPYYGLGINAGMESCRHLSKLTQMFQIGPKEFDWEKIFSEFNKFKPHVDVLRIQSLKNAEELQLRTGSEAFLFRKEVERELQKRFPTQFMEAHSMLSFTNLPLQACGFQIQVQEFIAKTLCQDKFQMQDIDFVEAEQLIKKHACPNLFQEKMWYDKDPPPNNYLEVVRQVQCALGVSKL